MPITIDHQLREQITHDASVFPITYFQDELATLPNWVGPLHWHPEFEIATAVSGILDVKVGKKHLTLEAGDSIFINGNRAAVMGVGYPATLSVIVPYFASCGAAPAVLTARYPPSPEPER